MRWSDRDLQMESEEVAEVPVLFSKWKSTPERRGHVLWSAFLSSSLAASLFAASCAEGGYETDLWH